MKHFLTFIILISSILFSLPRYSIQESSGCINCHINPTGSGMRNDYGSNVYSLDELSIRKWINTGDEDWDGYISDNIQIGGEFRIQSYDGQDKNRIFPMQIDLYSNIDINDNVDLFFKYGDESEFYAILKNIFNLSWIKVGKTMPNYGFKLDDHTSFIRGGNSGNTHIADNHNLDQGLLFDYMSGYKDPIIIESGLKFGKSVNFTFSVSSGLRDVSDEELINFTSNINYINKLDFGSFLFGTSFMKEHDFTMAGLYGGFSRGKMTFSYEIDKTQQWISDYESIASYAEIAYKPIQGIHVIAKYDYFDKDYDLQDGAVSRYSLGMNVFPYNILEIKFQMRHYLVETLDLDLDTEYLIQFHTWF